MQNNNSSKLEIVNKSKSKLEYSFLSSLNAHTVLCRYCGIELKIPELHEKEHANCSNCGEQICQIVNRPIDTVIAYAVSALIFLCLSCFYPIIGLSYKGIRLDISLVASAKVMFQQNFALISNLLIFFVLLLPFLYLACCLYVFLGIKFKRILPLCRKMILLSIILKPWLMVDVFTIAILVSYIKLSDLVSANIGTSFWFLMLFGLCLTKVIWSTDYHWLIYKINQIEGKHHELGNKTLTICGFCGETNLANDEYCSFCHCQLNSRRPNSFQKTIAYLIVAILLYIPANLYPIMLTESMGQVTPSTIIGGVLMLWKMGSYPIALVIFVASVVVPVTKFILIILLCFASKGMTKLSGGQLTKLHAITEMIGKWSMVDVFVVTILVALVQMGRLMAVYPGIAALCFAGVVVFTMLSAMNFDLRLVWDEIRQRNLNDKQK